MRRLTPGHAYVLDGGHGLIKIGRTNTPSARFKAIQAMGGIREMRTWLSPQIEDSSALEARAHAALASCRVVGEWFACDFSAAVTVVEAMLPSFSLFDAAAHAERLARQRQMSNAVCEKMLSGARMEGVIARAASHLRMALYAAEVMNSTMQYLVRLWGVADGCDASAAQFLFLRLVTDQRVTHAQLISHMAAGAVNELHQLRGAELPADKFIEMAFLALDNNFDEADMLLSVTDVWNFWREMDDGALFLAPIEGVDTGSGEVAV